MKKLDEEDFAILRAAAQSHGGWRPWDGAWTRAERLSQKGLLLEAGTTAMPPYICYVISESGEQVLFGPR